MENHQFSTPKIVTDAPVPTWIIDVVRKNGDVLVGTLTVDNETLPPRKNKKKIAWKLPDDPQVIPKFGEHERKRLWELFKEQKKERRRQSKKPTTHPSGELETSESFTPKASPNPPSSGLNGDTLPESTAYALRESQNVRGEEKNPVGSPPPSLPNCEKADSVSPPPPPPGFTSDKVPLDQSTAQETTQSASPQSGEARAPSLQSACLPETPLVQPPPPPPGILSPAMYFTLDDDKPIGALGALVVPFFLQCVTTSTMAPWLAHSHLSLSQTTLALGSAQATARTYHDRLQQWQSLTQSNRWDCSGCTVQNLPLPNTVLLVLTGRTIQKQESLAYHLSLILTSASSRNFQITNEILSLSTLT